MKTITLTMDYERETKGAVRYKDVMKGSVMQTIYLRKMAFGTNGTYPKRLKVTVEQVG